MQDLAAQEDKGTYSRECISCTKVLECKGKPSKEISCINYVRRKSMYEQGR